MIGNIQQLLGQAIILLGILITGFGVYAFLKLDSFYARLVITSKVEAMGFTTITIGAILLAGIDIAAIKLAIILFFELLTVAAGAHAIARSAWKSGYRLPSPTPHDAIPESRDD